ASVLSFGGRVAPRAPLRVRLSPAPPQLRAPFVAEPGAAPPARPKRGPRPSRAGRAVFAAAAASRSPGASLESFRAHAPPLAVRCGPIGPRRPCAADADRRCRNVTAAKFKPAVSAGGGL